MLSGNDKITRFETEQRCYNNHELACMQWRAGPCVAGEANSKFGAPPVCYSCEFTRNINIQLSII